MVPWWVTLTLEFTSWTAVDATTTNSYIPNTQQNPMPGITWNSCFSPCPHGDRRATHCGVPLSSSLAKSSPLVVLVKLQESLHRVNSTPSAFFLSRTCENPLQVPGPPLQKGEFWHSQGTSWFQMLSHCSKSTREWEGSSISQDIAFTVHCSRSTL